MDATLHQDQTKLAIFVLKKYVQSVCITLLEINKLNVINQQMNGYI